MTDMQTTICWSVLSVCGEQLVESVTKLTFTLHKPSVEISWFLALDNKVIGSSHLAFDI